MLHNPVFEIDYGSYLRINLNNIMTLNTATMENTTYNFSKSPNAYWNNVVSCYLHNTLCSKI